MLGKQRPAGWSGKRIGCESQCEQCEIPVYVYKQFASRHKAESLPEQDSQFGALIDGGCFYNRHIADQVS